MIVYISDPKILPGNSRQTPVIMWQSTRLTKKRKSGVLLYTNDHQAESEIRETSPFTMATNTTK